MKKIMLVMSMLLVMVFTVGCSAATEEMKTVSYATGAADFALEALNFQNDFPLLLQDAVTPEGRDELLARCQTMLDEIKEFGQLEPPARFNDLHQSILEINGNLGRSLEQATATLEAPNFDPAQLKEIGSDMIQGAGQIQDLVDQITQLGGK